MLIDQNVLKSLVNDVGIEVFGTLIEMFKADSTDAIEKIKNCLSNGEYEQLSLEIHTLKSVSGTYGAMDVYEIAYRLNDLMKRQEPLENIREDIEHLVSLLNETMVALDNIDVSELQS